MLVYWPDLFKLWITKYFIMIETYVMIYWKDNDYKRKLMLWLSWRKVFMRRIYDIIIYNLNDVMNYDVDKMMMLWLTNDIVYMLWTSVDLLWDPIP